MLKVANHRQVVPDANGTCGLSCNTSTVRYAAPNPPASNELVNIRRKRNLILPWPLAFGPCLSTVSLTLCRVRAVFRFERQVYTSTMLVDIDAAVLENRRLSEHYSVLVLDAPAIA